MNKSWVVFLVALFLCAYVSTVHSVVAQPGQTVSKLQAAENAMDRAFDAVLDAEKAGANVTGLLARLNVAEDLLAQADDAIRNGSSSFAVNTDSVLSIASQVQATAIAARNKALADDANALWSSVVFPAEGAIIFGIALFLVWSWLRRRHIMDMLEAKPEVNDQ